MKTEVLVASPGGAPQAPVARQAPELAPHRPMAQTVSSYSKQ